MLAGMLLALAGGLAGWAPRPAAQPVYASLAPHDIARLTTEIQDLQASIHVTRFNRAEMEKIGKDFGVTYRISHLTLQYKQPDKLRLSGRIPVLGEAVMIVNGATRYYNVPRVEKKVEDLEKTPSRRLSLLEYGGLLSPDTLQFMQGRFVREESLEGRPVLVFDMTYQGIEAGAHYRVWVDPKTRITCKREWYDRRNQLRATFYYQQPHEVAEGVWMPGRMEVQNADGQTAAATTVDNVKVNQGLSEDLFAIQP